MKDVAQNVLNADHQKPVEQQQYADITTITDSNYFPIASLERLGTAQDAQFQSGDQYGANYHWGSRYNESGETIVSTDETNTAAANATANCSVRHQGDGVWVENNARAQMPRSYDTGASGHVTYFNWYAATAESGKTSTSYGVSARDSVCPSGWKLPIDGDPSTAKSWSGLLFGTYGLSSSVESSKIVRSQPLSLTYPGQYDWIGDLISVGTGASGRWWSATASDVSSLNARFLSITSTTINVRASYSRIYGYSVRCIKD